VTDQLEYLEHDSGSRRWLGIAASVVAALALATLAAVGWADHTASSTTDDLAVAYTDAVNEAHAAEGRVQVALAYVAPAVWRDDLPPEKRDELWLVVSQQADGAADELSDLLTRVQETTVLPWRQDQSAARQALTELISDQENRFRSMAQDIRRVDLYLASGPVPTGAAEQALRAVGAPIR
jgi:hypothetical protein